jgi:hypothetical protein
MASGENVVIRAAETHPLNANQDFALGRLGSRSIHQSKIERFFADHGFHAGLV